MAAGALKRALPPLPLVVSGVPAAPARTLTLRVPVELVRSWEFAAMVQVAPLSVERKAGEFGGHQSRRWPSVERMTRW